MNRRTTTVAAAALAAGVLTAGPAAAAPPSTASNMGVCSSYLGHLQVRDDVNHLIREVGEVLGLGSPGELYRVRAHQHVNGTPEQECLKRDL